MQYNGNQELPETTLFSLESTTSLIHGHNVDYDMALLKCAALLYPNIVVHTHSGYDQLCEQVTQGLNEKQKLKVREFLLSANCTATIDHFVDVISKTGMFEHSIVVDNVDTMPGAGRREFLELDAIDYLNPISIIFINQFLELPYFEAKEKWEKFLSMFSLSELEITSDELITTAIPDLENLDWASVLELRESPFFTPFRNFMFGAYQNKNELLEKIDKSLWEVLGNSVPRVGESIIRRIIANIPLVGTPLPNPYSVYNGIMEIRKDLDTLKKYGWLFFIHHARSKTNN